jgi:hypothetical protein
MLNSGHSRHFLPAFREDEQEVSRPAAKNNKTIKILNLRFTFVVFKETAKIQNYCFL